MNRPTFTEDEIETLSEWINEKAVDAYLGDRPASPADLMDGMGITAMIQLKEKLEAYNHRARTDNPFRGGQVWAQPNFPNCRFYLSYIAGINMWVRLTMPNQRGSMSIAVHPTPEFCTEAELRECVTSLKYELLGQYHEIEHG